ncbi:MAG TPA: NnrU family protein [Steroidobacteraceae bacterium]|nr:NnrU family protein [Steroidobacteraceae bacterium]
MPNLIAASVFFLFIHFAVSGTRWRDALVARLGEGPYRGLFAVTSLVGLGWMIYAYRRAPEIPLWGPLPGLRPVAFILMCLAFLLIVIGLATPSPTQVGAEVRLTQGTATVRGIVRVTRHPFLWGVALWGLVHVAANGDLASLVFFGSLLLLAVGGTASIDAKRHRTLGTAWETFAQKTSSLPFAAIVSGRNSMAAAVREIGLVRPLVALIAYALVIVFHGRFFGAPLV